MIWLALAIGSLLGSTSRHGGTAIDSQSLADTRAMSRHLWDQRVDGFVVGVLTGLSSHILVAQNHPPQSIAALGLFAAFAISSTIGRSASSSPADPTRVRWSRLTRETSLAMVAAVAGWLIGSVR